MMWYFAIIKPPGCSTLNCGNSRIMNGQTLDTLEDNVNIHSWAVGLGNICIPQMSTESNITNISTNKHIR